MRSEAACKMFLITRYICDTIAQSLPPFRIFLAVSLILFFTGTRCYSLNWTRPARKEIVAGRSRSPSELLWKKQRVKLEENTDHDQSVPQMLEI